MGKLTIIEQKRGELAHLSSVERLEYECAPFLNEHYYLDYSAPPLAREAALEFFREKAASGELQQLVTKLEAAQQLAAGREIANQLATLTASYPNAAKADLSVYGAVLMGDVAAMHPSRYAIECACRKLRRTLKFLPAIAEVLEVVREEEREIRCRVRCFKKDVPMLLEPAEIVECPMDQWRREQRLEGHGG